MRELQECQAEVFRRSEIRIQARKKRRTHILMTCIPLVLCVSMAGTLHFYNRDRGSAPTEQIADEFNNATGRNDVIGVQITGGDITLYHTDPRAIQDIVAQLDGYSSVTAGSILDDAGLIPESAGFSEDTSETQAPADVPRGWEDQSTVVHESAQYATTINYTISLIREDGTITSYRLLANTLEDLTKNETYPLPQAELDQLKALLGMS